MNEIAYYFLTVVKRGHINKIINDIVEGVWGVGQSRPRVIDHSQIPPLKKSLAYATVYITL